MDNMIVSVSPHIRAKDNTSTIMRDVLIALLPAVVASVIFFGFMALGKEIVCVACCVFFEWLFEKGMKRPNTIGDLSAAVTGLILALNLPVGIQIWQIVVGAAVAIIVVKQLFGGIGKNFLNPALAGRAFLFASYAMLMTQWVTPAGLKGTAVDAITMRDYPLIQSYVVWMAIIYVLVNLITDLLYHAMDPRIRLGVVQD
mgnify:CR=1 FL=1